MSESSSHGPSMEILPSGRELVVAVSLEPATTLLFRDRTEQIARLANNILAAECAWMPGELVKLARDIVALRPTRVLPIETDPRSIDIEIATEADYEQAGKARAAMKEFRSFVQGIFNDAFTRLEQQVRDYDEGRGITQDRVQ
jgi:hypothetical protein